MEEDENFKKNQRIGISKTNNQLYIVYMLYYNSIFFYLRVQMQKLHIKIIDKNIREMQFDQKQGHKLKAKNIVNLVYT